MQVMTGECECLQRLVLALRLMCVFLKCYYCHPCSSLRTDISCHSFAKFAKGIRIMKKNGILFFNHVIALIYMHIF